MMNAPLIKPLELPGVRFPVNLIQGPLAGISSAAFRALVWQQSRPAFCCTEMISCKTLLYQPLSVQERYIKKSPAEGPVCFQLSGQDPVELGLAAKKVTDYGADLIDLNCGCPMKKIRTKGTGSRLLSEPLKLYHLICALKKNTSVPVSVKIRVDGRSDDRFNAEVAKVIGEAGADFLVVHGRHWREDYALPCYYPDIQFFVEALNIPVIGNGDISDLDSLKRMLQTGCAGVMVGRASVGQPWLIARLIAEMNQEDFPLICGADIGALLLQHVRQLALLLKSERMAVLETRSFAKYYARGFVWRAEFLKSVNACDSLDHFQRICQSFFTDAVSAVSHG